jgi:hypothetical protein
MMFAKPVALDRQAHRELLFQPMGGYEFAAGLNVAPLCASEFFPAAKEYAIVFVTGPQAEAFPVIVLGLNQGENCFVSLDGRWNARYLPLAVRAYPFAAVESANTGNLQVLIDESYPGFGDTAGAALFGDSGDPGPELQQRLMFLQAHQQEVSQTRRFGAELVRLGLLTERSAQMRVESNAQFQLNGFSVVDEAKLNAVGDAELLQLARRGHLSLITAHLLSLSNLGLLAPLLQQRQQEAGTAANSRPA